MRRRLAFVLAPVAACALALGACSPTWNWRELRLEQAPIRIQLPCKPEQASRRMPLAGEVVDLHMTGCATQGTTFAVTTARLAPGTSPAALLVAWRESMLQTLRASEVKERPYTAPGVGVLALPQSVRVDARGLQPDGQPVQASAIWFARTGADGVWVVHAAVYAAKPDPNVGETFLGAVRGD
ncbi:MAG: hypothetical protein Fur0019_07840 [Tibeticola sp.]